MANSHRGDRPKRIDVRYERLNLGLSQRQFAKAAGVSYSTVESLEGGRTATPKNAKKVADFLTAQGVGDVKATDLLPDRNEAA